jgi:hypothetical protein
MADFPDDMSLEDARAELRELVRDGHRCPVCTQFAKIYRRKLPSSTARVMIAIHREHADADGYVFLPDVLAARGLTKLALAGGYGTLAHHWGLMQQAPGERDDGSDHVGWWRLTDDGVAFVNRELAVRGYAHIYDGRCLGLHPPRVTITDCLGHRFDYDELMNA